MSKTWYRGKVPKQDDNESGKEMFEALQTNFDGLFTQQLQNLTILLEANGLLQYLPSLKSIGIICVFDFLNASDDELKMIEMSDKHLRQYTELKKTELENQSNLLGSAGTRASIDTRSSGSPTSPANSRRRRVTLMNLSNHRSSGSLHGKPELPSYVEDTPELRAMLGRYPGYSSTYKLDEMRQKEFKRLDDDKQVYLDYTGGGLYPQSVIKSCMDRLTKGCYGNPHSSNPTSIASTNLIRMAEMRVMYYFNCDPDIYTIIWTSNASNACKIVGEGYPFNKKTHVLVCNDNHTSTVGISLMARKKNAKVNVVYIKKPDMRLSPSEVEHYLKSKPKNAKGLFLYPAQSNVTGVQHPLEYIALAHKYGWDVFLDTAAFVPSNSFDTQKVDPEFFCISFYKMFGFPTGVGALIVKKETLANCKKRFMAGGTIKFYSMQANVQSYLENDNPELWMDGTVNYLLIPQVMDGLNWIESVGIKMIHDRVKYLTGYLLNELMLLKHPKEHGGGRLVDLYGPVDTKMRGGTISCNFYDSKGQLIPEQLVGLKANERKISLRAGCFCNAGALERAMNYGGVKYIYCLAKRNRLTVKDFIWCSNGRPLGAVRISIGMASTLGDVVQFVEFCKIFFDVAKTAKWQKDYRDNYVIPHTLC